MFILTWNYAISWCGFNCQCQSKGQILYF